MRISWFSRIGEKLVFLISTTLIIQFCLVGNGCAVEEKAWVYPARENGLWGYIDRSGTFVIDPQWKSVGEMRGNGYAWVSAPPIEREVFSEENGWTIESVSQEGIIDMRGEYVVPLQEESAEEGYSGEYFGGRDTGIITLGTLAFSVADGVLLPEKWEYLPWIDHKSTLVAAYGEDDTEMGFVDRRSGEVIIDFLYSVSNEKFCEGYVLLSNAEDGGYNLINEAGQAFTLPDGYELDWCSGFSEGLMPIYSTESGLYGFCDQEGTLKIEAVFEAVDAFHEGYASICVNGLWGHIDKTGNIIVPPMFDSEAYRFENGLAVLHGENEDMVISPDGSIIFAYPNARIWDFDSEGVAIFMTETGMGIVDEKGKILLDPNLGYEFVNDFAYGYAQPFPEGLMRVKMHGKIGYVNRSGELVIPFIWDQAEPFSHGLARVMTNDKLSYIDMKGNVIWEE